MDILVDRDTEFGTLSAAWEGASCGVGSMMMVTGEPGAGKTTLLRTLASGLPHHAVLWGACDPLGTPRPLGPVLDFAGSLGTVQRLIDTGAFPYDVYVAIFDELKASPHFLVVDDLQWADEATIDLLRFLVRRIEATASLVVGAYRDDEIGPVHPLRGLLGDLARTDGARQLPLAPLSLAAVTGIVAGKPVDPVEVHRLTGGNAFYVNQIAEHALDSGQIRDGGLPPTVRDAVLSRTATLDSEARDTLELLACVPEAIPDMALASLGIDLATLRRLDATGLVDRSGRGLGFRHELCRLAILETLPAGAEGLLHARILDALEGTTGSDPAFLTHHAVGAGDPDRIWLHATAAAVAATQTGAHTEAAAFYETALASGGSQPPAARAVIMEKLAVELYLLGRLDEAIAWCRQAWSLQEAEGDPTAVGSLLTSLAVYEWYNANRPAAEEYVAGAVATLESHDSGTALFLANAHAIEAYLAMHNCDTGRAADLLARARKLASTVDDPRLAVWLGLVRSAAAIMEGSITERDRMLVDIEEGIRCGLDEAPSTGWSNLVYLDVEQRRYSQADQVLSVSLPFTVERDLPICNTWQTGVRGRMNMMKGQWTAAVEDAADVLDQEPPLHARTWPHLVSGLVALRRGEPGAAAHLDQAWTLADRFGEPLRLLPAASALVEQMWLTGDHDPRVDEFAELAAAAEPLEGAEWSLGELAVWLHRIDRQVPLDRIAEPYRLHLSGDVQAAAVRWGEIGSRYDQALALTETGARDDAVRGVELLDLLGADAVAAKLRQDLRGRGIVGLPARRRATTLANPAGLTVRQIEVLRLISAGLTNSQVAERLFISRKTTDHHVSAILTKLQARTRYEAAAAARDLGIVR